MKKKSLLLNLTFIGLLHFFFSVQLKAEEITVTDVGQAGSFALVSNGTAVNLIVDNTNDMEVVSIAAKALSADVKLITGVQPSIVNTLGSNPSVIIGTLGKSTLINQLVTAGKIDKSRVEGKWETFLISVVDNPTANMSKALVIMGSDPRGTAFGVFELSRKMGVSPWVWWADVTPETKESIYIAGKESFGPPSVKYRGLFINDEDWGMQPWAAKNMDPTLRNGTGDIGPNAHKEIFELLLRMKANFFWPAMHGCTKAFWYYKDNPEMARKYQIVMGSSHCEPMLRNNEDEWLNNFASEYPGVTRGEWNWKVNSTVIKNYWIKRAQESANTNAIYTMGMRGVHDSQMLGYDTDKERAEALKDIIAEQRNILETYVGKPKATIPQLFCPYKEALLHYNEGINLPEDVTLLWPDDNHGFIRQLSTPEEQARSGGGGIYYHFSYWGPPRQDFLWLSSTSPVKVSLEMSKAYDLNAKNIWVFNVGDLKPTEYEFQFAMDLAWDVDTWRPEKAHDYTKVWAEENFGADLADDISDIQKQHYLLSASARPDQIDWVVFTPEEMEKRLADYATLSAKVESVESRVPERLKAAYFQLIVYPVRCSAAMNQKILGGRLNFHYAKLGRATEAAQIADEAKDAYRTIRDLTYTYNKVIANGKWDGMVNYAPKSMSYFYDPQLVTGEIMPYDTIPTETLDQTVLVPAKNYQSVSASVKVIEELGITGTSLAVLPLNMTQYTSSNITSAPYAEYKVALKKGKNRISVRCMPTFPLYPGLDLRYAISVGGKTPEFISLKTLENDSKWRLGVLRGFTQGDTFIDSDSDKDVSVKVYFADPGLVISAIESTSLYSDPMTDKIVNPDFEYNKDGNVISGQVKGDPYGWTRTGSMNGSSWGTNQDAINYHGGNVCWYASAPMPTNFQLGQTIKNLPAGEYLVRCRLAVPSNCMTTQRLFANKYVQYYGKETDYAKNLTSGEVNSFAGHVADQDGTMIVLREMSVKVIITEGENLVLGIRSSSKKGDGTTASDNSGWFKVDYFRLECLSTLTTQSLSAELADLIKLAQELHDTTKEGTLGGQYPKAVRTTFQTAIQSAQTVNQNNSSTMPQLVDATDKLKDAIKVYKNGVVSLTAYIVNASFEYKSDGVLNDGTTFRGTPYGWKDTGGIKGTSFGINSDANNKDGNNVCWYLSSPMPTNFELYQEIGGLPAGTYTVRCKLTTENGRITTQRLFANNKVQYYGYEADYKTNIAAGETVKFANWTGSTLNNYMLQEMELDVTITEGETLKLGIRTSNIKSDGSAATGSDGWFKVDNFRLELKDLNGSSIDETVDGDFFSIKNEKDGILLSLENGDPAHARVISLSGQIVYSRVTSDTETWIPLPKGLYIVQVTSGAKAKTVKALVR